MSRLELFIDDELVDTMSLDFVANSIIKQHDLIVNAIQKMKIQNRLRIMETSNWELYIFHPGKEA